MISKRQNVAWLRSVRGQNRPSPSSHPSRQRTNLSMPTIGESSVISNVDYDCDHAYGEMDFTDEELEFSELGPLKRPLRTRSCRIPTTSHSSSLKHKLKNRRLQAPMTEGWARLNSCNSVCSLFSFVICTICTRICTTKPFLKNPWILLENCLKNYQACQLCLRIRHCYTIRLSICSLTISHASF